MRKETCRDPFPSCILYLLAESVAGQREVRPVRPVYHSIRRQSARDTRVPQNWRVDPRRWAKDDPQAIFSRNHGQPRGNQADYRRHQRKHGVNITPVEMERAGKVTV